MPNTFFHKYLSHPDGLSTAEAEKRLLEYGPNELKAKKKKSLILAFLEEFKDLMVLILIGATIFALFSGETTDAIIIMVVLILNASIGFAQKYKAEKAIEALKRMVKPFARVYRDGVQKKIPAEQIVPGDILILNEGDSIPADAVLYETNELETQEAILTGESLPVEKFSIDSIDKVAQHHRAENLVYMGTMVTHGTGRAIVVKTGMQTEMGKIAELTTETKKDKSPLEKEIHKIGIFVGKVTLAISAVLFVFGYFFQHRPIIETLIFATAVAVAAVPEGLPATITIALAIGVQRLAKQNAIIKQLSSVETLGATTVICTDKTGTLTKNEMMVKEIDFDRYNAAVTGNGYDPMGTIHLESEGQKSLSIGCLKAGDPDKICLKNLHDLELKSGGLFGSLQLFMVTAALCNNAAIRQQGKTYTVIGDPTEGALITLAEKSGFRLDHLQKEYRKLHEFPFDSTRKRMTVIVENIETKKVYALSKGAPGNILETCAHTLLNSEPVNLSDDERKNILAKNELMAKKAYRCLALAYRELTAEEIADMNAAHDAASAHNMVSAHTTSAAHATPSAHSAAAAHQFPLKKETIEQNLTYIGILGMMDPPRPEVNDAIELTRKAGIRVYIVTGDYGLTAAAIARQIGLIQDKNHRIIHGDELEKISDQELKSLLSDKKLEIIFARVSPEHKLRIVSALKALGEIVAVTGDGVNDAPALKKADIGVAMGISGTDVSREAANMVLSDDSFSTIVTAVKEGRTIYENLRKFIFYVFSSNIGEVVLIFMAIILGLPAPLSAILILFVNLTTDMFPAIALGVEPAEMEVMAKKPRNPESKILNKKFVSRILFTGAFMGLITFLAYIWELQRYGLLWAQNTGVAENPGYLKATTLAFLLMVTIELVNTLNSRSESKSIFQMRFFSNPQLLGSIIISLLISVLIMEVPFFQKYFHTTDMDLFEWGIVIIGSLLILIPEEIRKYLLRHKAHHKTAHA